VGPAIVIVRVVCPSVCHTHTSPKLCEIDVWLLGNSNRNPGFPIQNLPSASWSEVRFRHVRCFRVHIAHVKLGQFNGELGTDTGLCLIWLKFRMMTQRKIPVGIQVSKLKEEVEFRRQGVFFRIQYRGIRRHWLRYLHQTSCAGRKWGPLTCGMVQYASFKDQRWRTAAF